MGDFLPHLNSSLYQFFEHLSWIANPDVLLPVNKRHEIIMKMISLYNPLDHIMGTEEAAARSNYELSQDRIKRLCQDGQLRAVKIGKQWVLDKNQEIKAKRKRSRSDYDEKK